MADLGGLPVKAVRWLNSGGVLLNNGEVIQEFDAKQIGLLIPTFDIGQYRLNRDDTFYFRIKEGE